ncbi:hypothetical protein GCM10009799_03940 [Nocardiopsis rhodophaea]|uniref:Uncharacterized protein n=1 Tax=Nocardiopsis rhodophaea TaxID=280238 RepID=A0ABN2S816_9ACTN
MRCVTLSDSSATFSGMWPIRSKLRSPAPFFSIRRAESARGGPSEKGFAATGSSDSAFLTRTFAGACGATGVYVFSHRLLSCVTHILGVARGSGYSECAL